MKRKLRTGLLLLGILAIMLAPIANAIDLSGLSDLSVEELLEMRNEIDYAIQEKMRGALGESAELVEATRANPALVGQAYIFEYESYSSDFTVAISVERVFRGEQANTILKSFNSYNTRSGTIGKGNEWMLVRLKIVALESSEEKISLSDYYFKFVDKDGVEYNSHYIADNPEEIKSLYVGSEQYAWFGCRIKQGDTPYITYTRSSDRTVWFNPNVRAAFDLENNVVVEINKSSSAEEIEHLQYYLLEAGYLSTLPTGKYSESTTSAVKKYQKALGLESTGVADITTLVALYSGTKP